MDRHAFLLAMGLVGASVMGGVAPSPLSTTRPIIRPVAPTQPMRVAEAEMARAATASAVASLYNEVADYPLAGGWTVGRYVKHMQQQEEFGRLLRHADQIGECRWLDSRTCQVQLEISADVIRRDLMRMAAAKPGASPLTAAQIDRVARLWPRQRFSATGTSATVMDVRPVARAMWVKVSDADRRSALARATADAVNRVMQSVSAVELGGGKTLGECFRDPVVNESVRNWLTRRPLAQVEFRDSLQVEVVLGVNEDDFFSVVREVLRRQGTSGQPKTEEEWTRVEQAFERQLTTPVGRASITKQAAVPRVSSGLPAEAPAWADRQIEMQGEARGTGAQLKTSLVAEANGRAALQSRIESLRLDEKETVGDVARRDRRVAEAVGRAARQARISRIEYRPDGQVVVHMWADLRQFWEDLRDSTSGQ